jgi:uncharacterized protein
VYELAMFPLGNVLLPSVVLPLHVFEPRYRALAEHLAEANADDPHPAEFGVVLIDRGSEVGGGDVRSMVGTVARAVEAQRFDDGRWALVSVGVRRVRVREWLADDPYPRAIIEDWPDEGSLDDRSRFDEVVAELRSILALAAELGDTEAPATTELSDDLDLGTFQIAALGPFGALDRQRLLAAPGPSERLEQAAALLAEHRELLEHRLRLDDDGGENGSVDG